MYTNSVLKAAAAQEKYRRVRHKMMTTLENQEEDMPVSKARVWEKFYKKLLKNVVLPLVVVSCIFAAAVVTGTILTQFGFSESVAGMIGALLWIAMPLLFLVLRGIYLESVAEVKIENKKLMRDLKGDDY
jgi:hypothetical protein